VRIALITEGSYPFSHGGVSVWCDQLVRGLPEHDFEVVALTGTGAERSQFPAPGNLHTVRSLPLWGPARSTVGRAAAAGRFLPVPRRRERPVLRGGLDPIARQAALALVQALVEPELAPAVAGFEDALRRSARTAAEHDIEGALLSPDLLDVLMQAWPTPMSAPDWGGCERGVPTVADAVTAVRLMAHMLRPLQHRPPRADVVHLVSNGIAGLVGLSAKWQHATPFVLSEHGVYLRERYLSFGRSSYSRPVKWLLMRFYRLLSSVVYAQAALVAPGNVYNQRWEVWDGVPDEVIRTVYNGVDPQEFTPVEIEPEVPTLVWVGRIDPIKDLETLVRAFALVREGSPRARLRIFGSVPAGNEAYHRGLQNLVGQLGLGSSVCFEGRVESVQQAYAAGHLVALTSISEGFPYTVIEAMSCGRATVSTDVGGVAEAVGDAGLVVPPRDPAAFAQACLRLLGDPVHRRALAVGARQRVIDLFTLEQSLAAFRTIYAEVRSGSAAGQQVPGQQMTGQQTAGQQMAGQQMAGPQVAA